MGGWLKEGSLVARDNLAVYGVQMRETLGKMFEVINYVIIQVQ